MKGMKAVTNFDLNHYDIKSILESKMLPIGKGASKLLKMTEVDEVLKFKRKDNNNQNFTALQLQLDTSTDQIVTEPIINRKDHSMLDSLTSPTRIETSNIDIAGQNVLDNQNPSSSLFHVYQNHPEFQSNYIDSSYGLIGSSAAALRFQIGRVSELDHSAEMTVPGSCFNGIWQVEDQYRQLSECSQALEDLELENFQSFENQFDFQSNPSFQTVNGSQNYHDQLHKNPSFLHLLVDNGSVDGSLRYPSASYWRINDDQDDDHLDDLTRATEAGKSSNMASIFGKEIQQMETSEYDHDFRGFHLDNGDTNFQNPNYPFFPH
ncbi:hypothetical protein PanWU01x14_168840 [Parasponia andersonii]|uniref:Uncharacterized protein n=1 Tax=Parasponia andersonii TaxID=3476 RepID=A0A2P5CAT8_PARAD|nr:hypothetical protein PanWU01x14_168840 [Parasponia andersonii]